MLRPNLKTDLNYLININHLNIRSISFFGFGKNKKTEEDVDTAELSADVKEPLWDHLSEEKIDQIRNRSKLTTKERDRFKGKLSERIYLTELYQYKTPYVRNLYAMFGKESGLKPGVCWPRREELEFKMKYEETFYPPLDQLMKELADEKAAEAKAIKEREDEIRKGLKKMDKYKKQFYEKFNQKQSEFKEKEDKEAKRIEEICDFLGYAISPTDPRFEAAAQKKAEMERKEQMKMGVAKKTRQQKMLEELQQLIEKNQQAEQEAKKKEDDVDQTKNDDSELNKDVEQLKDNVSTIDKKEAKDNKKVDKTSDQIEKKKTKMKKEDKTKNNESKDD